MQLKQNVLQVLDVPLFCAPFYPLECKTNEKATAGRRIFEMRPDAYGR